MNVLRAPLDTCCVEGCSTPILYPLWSWVLCKDHYMVLGRRVNAMLMAPSDGNG